MPWSTPDRATFDAFDVMLWAFRLTVAFETKNSDVAPVTTDVCDAWICTGSPTGDVSVVLTTIPFALLMLPVNGTFTFSEPAAGRAVVAPSIVIEPSVAAPLVTAIFIVPVELPGAALGLRGSKLKLFWIVTASVSRTSVALVTPAGRFTVAVPPPVNAGFGMIRPSLAAQLAQSCPSVRVMVVVLGLVVTWNAALSAVSDTPVGRKLLTAIVVLCDGTFQTMSYLGSAVGTSHPATPRSARKTPAGGIRIDTV